MDTGSDLTANKFAKKPADDEKIQQTKNAIRPRFMSVSDEEIKKYLAGGEDLVATIT